jgi:ATP-dependent DNA helicase RecG
MADLEETRLTAEDIRRMAADLESDRVERKADMGSKRTRERIQEAVCAFANDMPGHGKPGYLLLGVTDDGRWSGVEIDDMVLRNLSNVRDNGKILPLPEIQVYKVDVEPGVSVAVVEVYPHTQPPVRFDGRTWIRVGPRRAIATLEDERMLAERRQHLPRAWDEWLCNGAKIGDLRLDYIRDDYVPRRVAPDILAAVGYAERSDIDVLDTLRLWYRGVRRDGPTHGAVLLFSHRSRHFYNGLWVQFVRFAGEDRTADPVDHQEYDGDVFAQLRALEKVEPHIQTVRRADGTEGPEYPAEAIREAVINAIMHQDFADRSPIQFYWFDDYIQIVNSGGLMPKVAREVFDRDGPPPGFTGRRTAYRNEAVSEAMKSYGYVQKFGTGIPKIRRLMFANGNPYPEYEFTPGAFGVRLYSARLPRWETKADKIRWLLDKEGNEELAPHFRDVEQTAEQRGHARGELAGRRESLFALLEARGMEVTEALRNAIDACEDPDQLSIWHRRAVTASVAEDILPS